MPAVSRQQYKFFKSMSENPKEAAKKGVSPEVAHEFTDGMTKNRWSKLKKKISKD